MSQQLTNLTGTINCAKQNNTITLETKEKYVTDKITLNVQVTKAILTNQPGSNSFDIQIPNGPNRTVTLHFAVDGNSNTTITDIST